MAELGWPAGYAFSVYLGLFMWGGLWLRHPKLRELFPLVRSIARENATTQT